MSSRAYFDGVAPQWDNLRETFFSDQVRTKAISAAGLTPGLLAADIGSGSGFITEALVKAGINVIAVDQSPQMLEVLRAKFADAESLDCRLGDAQALPIGDEPVDAAFANMYLHHVDDPLSAIREMTRILRPGGILVLTDLDTHEFEFLRREHHDRWMGFERTQIMQWFEKAGLDSIRVKDINESCCTTSATSHQTAEISIFLASGHKYDN